MKNVHRLSDRRIKHLRILLSGAAVIAAGLSIFAFTASPPGIRRIDLQRHDIAVAGREVIQVRVEIDAGESFGSHHHPGEEVVYVLSGMLEYTLEGRPTVTLRAGDVLFIPAGFVHSARNRGTESAAELATCIVEKGKPLLVLDPSVGQVKPGSSAD